MAAWIVIVVTVAVVVAMGGFALRRRHPEMASRHGEIPDSDDNDPRASSVGPAGAGAEPMLPTARAGDALPAEPVPPEPGDPRR